MPGWPNKRFRAHINQERSQWISVARLAIHCALMTQREIRRLARIGAEARLGELQREIKAIHSDLPRPWFRAVETAFNEWIPRWQKAPSSEAQNVSRSEESGQPRSEEAMGRVEGETGESVGRAKHARQGSYSDSRRPQEEVN